MGGAAGVRPGAGAAGADRRVVLYSRVGCHLCDDARGVVAAVCATRGQLPTEVDVDTDEQLRRAHGDRVPVVTVDGVVVDFFRVDAARLAARLDAPAGGRPGGLRSRWPVRRGTTDR